MSRRRAAATAVLPVAAWPPAIAAAWRRATAPGASRFDRAKDPAAGWAADTRSTIEEVYGLYAGWLRRQGIVDGWPTEERIGAYLAYLLEERRQAATTVAKQIDGLWRLMRVIAPSEDWGWLKRLANQRQRIASRSPKPLADQRGRVGLDRLEALGQALLAEARASRRRGCYAALRYRDGLMILVLARRALRRKNLIQIRRGNELVLDDDGAWLRFSAQQMKGKRRLELPVSVLRAEIDEYLRDWLPILGSTRPEDPFWPSRFGGAICAKAASKRVGDLTEARLGVRTTMHAFRHALATTVAERLPGGAAVATPVLGHASGGITERAYARFAQGLAAQAEAEGILAKEDPDRDLRRALRGQL
jgi:integrase